MPSPFPGMDPYLEGEMWQEFHDRLANQISQQLLPRLKPRYVALLAKRFAFEYPNLSTAAASDKKTIYPDVHIVKQTREGYIAATLDARDADITPAPLELKNPLPEPVPYLAVEIRDVAERRLVTVIEILSPENKRGKGAHDYREKRQATLDSVETDTHLLELDLLRQGTRIKLVGESPPAAYYAILSRWNKRPKAQVWAIQLREKLPTLPVPLLPPDPDVKLNLQAALNACFELVGYDQLLDYSQPLPELSAEDAAWVRQVAQTSSAVTFGNS